MAIQRVVVERRRNRLGAEEKLIVDHAEKLGIPVIETNEKSLSRDFFKFYPTDLVVGGILFMKHALRAYGKELSEHIPYPECLLHLMQRDVWYLPSLRQAKELLDKGEKFFIKPQGWKCFTGFVAESSDDFRFNGTSGQQPVIISDLVKFVSEYRYYVAKGVIVASAHYEGDVDQIPNLPIVQSAVNTLTADKAPAGYVIDFGVLENGNTVLVEINDGWSVGAYGNITGTQLWEVLAARWQEMIEGGNRV